MVEPTRRKHVALAFPLAVPHLALFVQGVAQYAREHGGWTFSINPAAAGGYSEHFSFALDALAGWSGDGIMAYVTDEEEMLAAKQLRIPIVTTAGFLRDPGVPRVTVDNRAIGRLAAQHLLECGLRRFAYLGQAGIWFSQLRGEGFAECVRNAGGECLIHETTVRTDRHEPWHIALEEIERFLLKLRPPVGILAVHDYRARLLVDVCHKLGLSVPNDVAVIGTDNDEMLCEFCDPPLSSVSRSGYRVGYESAALLDRLMAGQSPPKGDILIPPDGVVARKSTDLIAIEDLNVVAAIRFMQGHLDEPFGVERLLRLLPLSRSRLERLFRKHLGQTPYEYLRALRVARAKELLVSPEKLSTKEIARRCGFPDARRLRLTFARLEGVTPSAYRCGNRTE